MNDQSKDIEGPEVPNPQLQQAASRTLADLRAHPELWRAHLIEIRDAATGQNPV